MRLWHIDLLSKLPRQQLLGQHRECCALRGKGWGKPHSTVNYVFDYPLSTLFTYHMEVVFEMESRGYKPHWIWKNECYRGKEIGYDFSEATRIKPPTNYKEHNEKYYQECIDNLKEKGVLL